MSLKAISMLNDSYALHQKCVLSRTIFLFFFVSLPLSLFEEYQTVKAGIVYTDSTLSPHVRV